MRYLETPFRSSQRLTDLARCRLCLRARGAVAPCDDCRLPTLGGITRYAAPDATAPFRRPRSGAATSEPTPAAESTKRMLRACQIVSHDFTS
jgi:hypothetical protein